MMKLELTSTKTNPLIGRREVSFRVEEKSTPNRSSIRVELATALRVNLDQVVVREIETKSGTHVTVGLAHVYDDAATALRVEPKYVTKRNEPKAKAEAEEKKEAAA
jgi:ribosomal protein S24E